MYNDTERMRLKKRPRTQGKGVFIKIDKGKYNHNDIKEFIKTKDKTESYKEI